MNSLHKVLYTFIIILLLQLSTLSISSELTNNLKNKAKSNATNKLNSFLSETLGQMFPTSEVSLSSGNTDSVSGSILFVKPLTDIEDTKNTIFTQGSIFFTKDNEDSRETINFGIGDRYLTMNDKLMLGANIFYDHELNYDHQRASFGLEAKTSVGEFTANHYYGLSGWRDGLNGTSEKPLDGHDYEVGAPLPYLPWANFYVKSFKWDGASGSEDIEGDEITLKAVLPIGLDIEAGKRSFSSAGESDKEFIKLVWTCCNKNNEQPKFGISDKAYNLTSVVDKRFVKVRRENRIVKQNDLSFNMVGF
jgi:hypothetical protein